MFLNYLKIATRYLLKNSRFSLINIVGMSVSLASVLVISLFVIDELRYDEHIANAERKFRIYNHSVNDNGVTTNYAVLPYPMLTFIKKDLPGVKTVGIYMQSFRDNLVENGDKKIYETGGIFAETGLAKILNLKFLSGNSSTALEQPMQVVLTQSAANKFFGHEEALNKTIRISKTDYLVTGVIADLPATSHLKLNYIMSFSTITSQWTAIRFENWINQQYSIYVELEDGVDAAAFEKKLQGIIEQYAYPKTKAQGFYYIPHLQAIRDIHLSSGDFQWDIAERGNRQTVYILGGAAVLIIVIACLNFINLSTARSLKRMKEVGVRKVAGALRQQLIMQFISESLIIAILSLIIAIGITEMTIPALNNFTGKSIPDPFNFLNTTALVAFALLLGVASGSYPAFHLSAFRPALMLSDKHGHSQSADFLRKSLVVVQFAFSFFLIISASVVMHQHNFLKNKSLGFNKEQLIVLPLSDAQLAKGEAIKNEYNNHGNVLGATLSYGLPGGLVAGDNIYDPATDKTWSANMIIADPDYVNTLGMEVVTGRDFARESAGDQKHGFVLNEEAVRAYGFGTPEEALGRKIDWYMWGEGDSVKHGEVIGVVKDFHIRNFREKIAPVVIHVAPRYYYTLTLRVKPQDISTTIAHLKATWEKHEEAWPFQYQFLDESFDAMVKSEEKLSTLLNWFTSLAILVACLGLFGLVEYSVNHRRKEISIRKILGASLTSLLITLGRQYLVLTAIAFVVIIPVSYWAADQWLQGFEYRIGVQAGIFLNAALIIVGITTITVVAQSIRAALANPASVLRSE